MSTCSARYDRENDVLYAHNVELVHAHVERDGKDTLILCKFRIRNFHIPYPVARLLLMLSSSERTLARDVYVREGRPTKVASEVTA